MSKADVEKGNPESGNQFEQSAMNASASRQNAIQGPGPGIRRIANPGPLGLMSFASTTLMLSLYNVNVRHVTEPNVVVGMALGVGGLCQLLAGQWEFVCGNTFGATAFSSYGGFWISYALIFWPGSGVLEAFGEATGHAGQLHDALGVYLITWFIVTFIFLLAALRSHVAFIALFSGLSITFMLLAIGAFLNNVKATKAGGAFGIFTAFVAYYAGASSIITKETAFVNLPVKHLRRVD